MTTSDPSLGRTDADCKRRWSALAVISVGVLMIVIDGTIVNVALPPIRSDLGFSTVSLAWVINAYLVPFGGFLLLGGRLGDFFGQRLLFLSGVVLFTISSLICGLTNSQGVFIFARVLQGLGGAVVSAVAISLIFRIFTETHERAKALGILGFVSAAGGSTSLLLGGILITALNWHWIFLINLPIGVTVYALGPTLLPRGNGSSTGPIDVAGAVTITSSLMLMLYAIVNRGEHDFGSAQTVELLACAFALLVIFFFIEARVSSPLMPLGFFRLRSVAVASVATAMMSVALLSWYFISTLYLQLLLEYSPLKVGLAFLPTDAIIALFSLGLSAGLVVRFGITPPLTFGLLIVSLGLFLFARAPVVGTLDVDVLPGMLLLGLGCGIASTPLTLAAMTDVAQEESGLASGIVGTASTTGGTLGLAIIVSLASARTKELLASGTNASAALNGGYHLAFAIGAISVAIAALLCAALLRVKTPLASLTPEPAREHGSSQDFSEDVRPPRNVKYADGTSRHPKSGNLHVR